MPRWRWPWRWKRSVDSSVATLSQLLQRLCDADIDFVVFGGFAALLHGSTLVTRDLDICAVLSHSDVAKLRETRDAEALYAVLALPSSEAA